MPFVRWLTLDFLPGNCTVPVRYVNVVIQPHYRSWPRISSSAADSSNTSFESSSKAFFRSRKIVSERDLYPLLREVIGAAVCISVAMATIVPIPFLEPRE